MPTGRPWIVALLSTLLVTLIGCGTSSGSAQEFARLAQEGVTVDIEPLKSPADARARSNLVVRGTLTDVKAGVQLASDDPAIQSRFQSDYSALVIEVQEVVDGDESLVHQGVVYANVLTGETSPGRLARANPRADVVAVLYALPKEPIPGVRYDRSSAIPQGAPLLGGFLDGVWLQGSADSVMYGLHGDPDTLPASWSRAKTVDAYASQIRVLK